jgi:hypothetical protein
MSGWTADNLIETLRSRHQYQLIDQDVSALLAWLSRSSNKPEAQPLIAALGEAGDWPAMTEKAYRLLDETLFIDGRLDARAAGVDTGRSDSERRRRFRLLLSAFHPDRQESMADWLNKRSQTLTRAYSEFKSGRSDTMPAEHSSRDRVAVRKQPKPAYEGIAQKWHERLRGSLRERIHTDRFLGHKIVGALASILLLAMVSIMLSESPQDKPSLVSGAPNTIAGGSLAAAQPESQEVLEPSADVTRVTQDRIRSDRALTGAASAKPAEAEQKLAKLRPAVQLANVESAREVNEPSPDRPTTVRNSTPRERLEPDRSQAGQNIRAEPAVARPMSGSGVDASTSSSLARTQHGAGGINANGEQLPPAADAPEHAIQVVRSEPLGNLELGPLRRHQVADLLRRYQLAVENGNPVALIELFNAESRSRVDLDGLVELGSAEQRALSLSIVNSRTEGEFWRLEVLHRLESLEDGRRLAHAPRLAVFRFSQTPAGLWIEEIRFDDGDG